MSVRGERRRCPRIHVDAAVRIPRQGVETPVIPEVPAIEEPMVSVMPEQPVVDPGQIPMTLEEPIVPEVPAAPSIPEVPVQPMMEAPIIPEVPMMEAPIIPEAPVAVEPQIAPVMEQQIPEVPMMEAPIIPEPMVVEEQVGAPMMQQEMPALQPQIQNPQPEVPAGELNYNFDFSTQMVNTAPNPQLQTVKPKTEFYAEAMHTYFVAQVGFSLLAHNNPQFVEFTGFKEV